MNERAMGDAHRLPSVRFRYRLSPLDLKRGLWMMVVVVLGLAVLGALVGGDSPETLLEDLGRMPVWAWGLAAAGSAMVVVLLARLLRHADNARLTVDRDGIRCSPHKLHGQRFWSRHDWQLSWSQIRKATLFHPPRKSRAVQAWLQTTLELEGADQSVSMGLLHWEPEGQELERPSLTTLQPFKQLRVLIDEHPLPALLEQAGVPLHRERVRWRDRRRMADAARAGWRTPEQGGAVDLLAWPSLVAILALMVVLGSAAALHFVVLDPIRPLWAPQPGPLLLVGAGVFAVAALVAHRAPVRERMALALLLGALSAALFHPFHARALVLAAGSSETVSYQLIEAGRFRSLDADYPAMNLSNIDIPEYWRSLAPDSDHEFEIYSLGNDRYVLDLAALYERTRAFYEQLD
ncbi:MAG: hypothetical protein HND55_02145 [Pseudomonadota bacterium]|nr:MAG: hypothetical protein HND55_02145 [Pseudomonadota bacterium]